VSTSRYDRIGLGHKAPRRADPRIERFISDALRDSRSVVNVGAGTGGLGHLDEKVGVWAETP